MAGQWLLFAFGTLLCSTHTWASARLDTSNHTSNYAERGVDVEYQGKGIPQEATLDGIVTRLDDLSHTIRTNRSTAFLSCESRAMDIDLEFNEPFYGIVYADFTRTSSCSLTGTGETKYRYELPLAGCGTLQDPLRVFTNNIIVRFHPSLELEGDEVKTIVCRYPEPKAPIPVPAPDASIAVKPVLAPVKPEGFGGTQILLIICGLLFLAFMLFGVACSYFCLKQRNIQLIRPKRLLSSGTGSGITKMSESSVQLPMFIGMKIPRVELSNSGSEQELVISTPPDVSETLPSDYPSESRSSSEIEGVDVRSLRQASTISSMQDRDEVVMVGGPVTNLGYTESEFDRLSSVYSDAHAAIDVDVFGASMMAPRVKPYMDVAFRIKDQKRPSPAPSSVTSEESHANLMMAQERTLTTILEREEWRNDMPMSTVNAQMQSNADLNPAPHIHGDPNIQYAQLKRKAPSPPRSLASIDTEMTDPRSVSEIVMKSTIPYVPVAKHEPEVSMRVTTFPQTPHHETNRTLVINEDIQLHTSTLSHVRQEEETETMIIPTLERPVPPPKLTTQEVDDVYLKTITEKRIIEEDERIRRQITEFHRRPQVVPSWDVTINQYPPPPPTDVASESTDWDAASQATVPPNPQWDVKIRQFPPVYESRTPSVSTNWDGMSTAEPLRVASPPQWDVSIRQYPPVHDPRTPSESTDWDATSQVEPMMADDMYVKTITEKHVSEEEERIRRQTTEYHQRPRPTLTIPPPPQWDVEIRQYPQTYEPRTPSVSTNWDGMSTAEPMPASSPPQWDVSIRQYPPVHNPRSPSESTDWDATSQIEPVMTDDLFMKTITEKRIAEEEERIRRQVIEYHQRPAVPPPHWDVTIRQYPPIDEESAPSEITDWDAVSQSDVGSERPRPIFELPPVEEPVDNWDVLIRVLNPPPQEEVDDDDVSSVLTVEDRNKWHQIITTESTLRTRLTEAVVREDFERIRRDVRYERIFEPKKWDVIIRVLAAPPSIRDDTSDSRSETTTVHSEPIRSRLRKRSDFDPRSRKSSLAPVHETDHAASVPRVRPPPSFRSDDDLRSLTETTVNYGKYEPDVWSESSGNTFRSGLYQRSTADRSHSEIMERQNYPEDWDQSDTESGAGRTSGPSLARSTTEMTERNWTTHRVPFDRVSSTSGYSYSSSTHRRPMLERSSTEIVEDIEQISPDVISDTNSFSSSPAQYRRKRIPFERVSSCSGDSESGSHAH